ncbi:MAG: hypothetical protein ACI841_002865 [Planctomycetota bacterium]|jgi:hypothetical protein
MSPGVGLSLQLVDSLSGEPLDEGNLNVHEYAPLHDLDAKSGRIEVRAAKGGHTIWKLAAEDYGATLWSFDSGELQHSTELRVPRERLVSIHGQVLD